MRKLVIPLSIILVLLISVHSNLRLNTDSTEMPSQMSPREAKLIETCDNITKNDKKSVKKCVNFHIETANFTDVAKIAEHIPIEEWHKKEQLIYEQSMKMIQALEATNQSDYEQAMSLYIEVKDNGTYLDNVRTIAEKEIGILAKRFEGIKEVQTRIDDIRKLIDDKKIKEAKIQLEPMLFELSGDPLLKEAHAQIEAMLKEIN
jgi:hypothetical protein